MSNIVIARKTEKKLLDEAFQSNESEFIAIYGRRRIGKTYLIKNHYNKKKCLFLYVVGMQHATLEEQLENFIESLSETILEGIPLRTPTSWKEAFKTLNDLIKERLKKEKVVALSKHEGISRTDLRDAVKLTASGGTLSTRLLQLEQTGFILSFIPMGNKSKGSSEQGAQIDLLFERKDDAITLGEMKCTDAPYVLDKQQADILMRKITVFRKTTGIDKQIITAFISANGIKKTLYSEELIASVITADDLFRD